MSIIPKFFVDATVALGVPAGVPGKKPFWCATGFVVGRFEGTIDGEGRYTTYLITNKHVVRGEKILTMQVNSSNGVKTYPIQLEGEGGERLYSEHPHSEADVAACSIDINPAKAEGAELPFYHLEGHTLTLRQMKDTGVCEGSIIYTLGFPVSIAPNFVNDVVKAPVCRMGCISRVEDTYHVNDSKTFIIDAMAFPGNSGGPIISRPERFAITETPFNSSANLIGIVSGHLPYREVLYSRQTNKDRVVNEDNSGLTVAISVDCIKEVVELERTRVLGLSEEQILSEMDEAKDTEPAWV